MIGRAAVLGAGLVDLHGIVGTCGADVAWSSLEQEAPGTGRTMRAVFDKGDATFRRLDLPSRALVLACEAAGVGAALTDEQRQRTALLVDTACGSLASDRRFAASLGDDMVAAGVFPFTLPSTTLGEVALRFRLRGPTISWSVESPFAGECVREALRQFAAGEIDHAVIGTVDALPDANGEGLSVLRAMVAVIAPDEHGDVMWPGDELFGALLRRWRDAPVRPGAQLLGCGMIDEVGIRGSRGVCTTWQELGQSAPGTGRTMRTLFDKTDATFRRLDAPGRALVLACEAAGVDVLLSSNQRNEAAILVETDIGALAADQQFTASLSEEALAVSVFPFVLTTTCLGEVALRFRLRGPTCSHSVRGDTGGQAGESVREALRMFAAGEAEHAVVGVVEMLPQAACGREPALRAVVAVLGRETAQGLGGVRWPEGGDDPFAGFAARCFAATS